MKFNHTDKNANIATILKSMIESIDEYAILRGENVELKLVDVAGIGAGVRFLRPMQAIAFKESYIIGLELPQALQEVKHDCADFWRFLHQVLTQASMIAEGRLLVSTKGDIFYKSSKIAGFTSMSQKDLANKEVALKFGMNVEIQRNIQKYVPKYGFFRRMRSTLESVKLAYHCEKSKRDFGLALGLNYMMLEDIAVTDVDKLTQVSAHFSEFFAK